MAERTFISDIKGWLRKNGGEVRSNYNLDKGVRLCLHNDEIKISEGKVEYLTEEELKERECKSRPNKG
jgi:hypothetical protein